MAGRAARKRRTANRRLLRKPPVIKKTPEQKYLEVMGSPRGFLIACLAVAVVLLMAGCGSSTSSAGFERALETKGWGTNTIGISAHIEQARYWKGINFVPGRQITIGADSGGPRRCGNAVARWNSSGIIYSCHIKLNYDLHSQGLCGSLATTIQHEIGHCLGLPHSATGIMSKKANGGSNISAETQAQFNQLYGVKHVVPKPTNKPVKTQGLKIRR